MLYQVDNEHDVEADTKEASLQIFILVLLFPGPRHCRSWQAITTDKDSCCFHLNENLNFYSRLGKQNTVMIITDESVLKQALEMGRKSQVGGRGHGVVSFLPEE